MPIRVMARTLQSVSTPCSSNNPSSIDAMVDVFTLYSMTLVTVRVADFRAIIEWIQKRIMDAGRS